MKLSVNAIENLRLVLLENYGSDFCNSLTDDDLTEIGLLLLNILKESLLIKTTS